MYTPIVILAKSKQHFKIQKQKMQRNTCSQLTVVPIYQNMQINCLFFHFQTTTKESSACNYLSLELRFVFSILAHLGNLLAPLIFALLNVRIRKALKEFLQPNTSCDDEVYDNKDMVLDQTMVTSAPTCDPTNKAFTPDL